MPQIIFSLFRSIKAVLNKIFVPPLNYVCNLNSNSLEIAQTYAYIYMFKFSDKRLAYIVMHI